MSVQIAFTFFQEFDRIVHKTPYDDDEGFVRRRRQLGIGAGVITPDSK